MKERTHLGNLGIGGRIILKWILKEGCEDVDWVHVAQNRVQWQSVAFCPSGANRRTILERGDPMT